MTTDELVELAEALVGPLTVREAISAWDDLDDHQTSLLVRFVAGERPEQSPAVAGPTPAPPETRPERQSRSTYDRDEHMDRLRNQLQQTGEDVPAEPVESRSFSAGRRTSEGLELDTPEFEGVTLP